MQHKIQCEVLIQLLHANVMFKKMFGIFFSKHKTIKFLYNHNISRWSTKSEEMRNFSKPNA